MDVTDLVTYSEHTVHFDKLWAEFLMAYFKDLSEWCGGESED